MASGRSSAMDQAGPSSASLAPLPGKFLGLALDMRSDGPYDLVPDIPDVIGLRALRPSAAIVKVMSSAVAPHMDMEDSPLLEFVGAPESARLLYHSPTFWVDQLGEEQAMAAAVNL